jgi:hypothetical protein
MPKFTVEANSNHDTQATFQKIKTFLESDQDLRKLDSKLSCSFNDSDLSCNATGSQFKAQMKVLPAGSNSKVEVLVDLPLMLTPFKGKVQEILSKKLSKVLA